MIDTFLSRVRLLTRSSFSTLCFLLLLVCPSCGDSSAVSAAMNSDSLLAYFVLQQSMFSIIIAKLLDTG